jgi:hypothetical protein
MGDNNSTWFILYHFTSRRKNGGSDSKTATQKAAVLLENTLCKFSIETEISILAT